MRRNAYMAIRPASTVTRICTRTSRLLTGHLLPELSSRPRGTRWHTPPTH